MIIRAGDVLRCADCDYTRTISDSWLQDVCRRYFPGQGLHRLPSTLLLRLRCTKCLKKNIKLVREIESKRTPEPDQRPASTIDLRANPPIAVGGRDLTAAVIERATNIERETLLRWAKDLLAIRETPLSTFDKTSRAISITVESGAILPFIKTIGLEVKRIGWDERSLPARIGLSAAAFTVLLLSGEGAGIAALGGAISVPLWVVFGAGGAFAGALIEELMRIPGPERKVTTIDSDVVEVQHRDRT